MIFLKSIKFFHQKIIDIFKFSYYDQKTYHSLSIRKLYCIIILIQLFVFFNLKRTRSPADEVYSSPVKKFIGSGVLSTRTRVLTGSRKYPPYTFSACSFIFRFQSSLKHSLTPLRPHLRDILRGSRPFRLSLWLYQRCLHSGYATVHSCSPLFHPCRQGSAV